MDPITVAANQAAWLQQMQDELDAFKAMHTPEYKRTLDVAFHAALKRGTNYLLIKPLVTEIKVRDQLLGFVT